jgi:hypothetical protein
LVVPRLGLGVEPASPCGVSIPAAAKVPEAYITSPGLLALRADVLLRQIKLGYNYYGQPRNWIPPVSLTEFRSQLKPILDNLQTVEAYLASTACDLANQQADNQQFNNTLQNIATLNDQLALDLNQGNQYIKQILVVISDLANDIASQFNVVQQQQAEFNAEVQRNASGGDGCGFQVVFEIVVAIVAVVAAVYTAGASLAALASSTALAASSGAAAIGAGATSVENLKKAYESFQTIEKNIETAKAKVDDIVAKFNALKQDFAMSVSQDTTRIALDESGYDSLTKDKLANFDKTIDGANVSSATKEQFKATVHKYVQLVQLRNKKIFDHDSMVLTIQSLARRIVELEVQSNQVHTAQAAFLQSNNLPDSTSYVALIKQAQEAQLMIARDLVWNESAAFSLMTMDSSLAAIGGVAQLFSYQPSVANLVQIHNQTQQRVLNWEIDRGPGTSNEQHAIRKSLSFADLKQLRETRRLNFAVTERDLTPSMREVYVTGFRVTCEPAIVSLSGKLSHMGEHKFITQDGQIRTYCSKVFPFAFSLADATPHDKLQDVTENGVYVGFAALGSWMLEIDSTVPLETLEKVRTIVFTAGIRYRAATA